jgi:hypothetical protein
LFIKKSCTLYRSLASVIIPNNDPTITDIISEWWAYSLEAFTLV